MEEISGTHLQRKRFINYWEENDFKNIKPISIIPPTDWQSTLFVNSGLIGYVKIVKEKKRLSQSLTTCQPCIKVGSNKFSLDKMMFRDGYFSFFEQLSCGGGENISIEWFIKKVWNYLLLIANLPLDKIYIGVNPFSPEIKDYWEKSGVPNKNIIFPDPKAFILNLPMENIQGSYSPFYYDRGANHPLACKRNNCNINCDCGRFLELGDIGVIFLENTRIIDHGIGLERITSIQNGLLKVTDIREFSVIVSLLENKFQMTSPHFLTIADHLRSSIILLSLKLNPGNKKKEYALRNLIRRIFWLVSRIYGFDKGKIQDIYIQAAIELNNFSPYLEIDQEIVTSEINKEILRYEKLLKNGRRILKKYFREYKSISQFSEKELKFLYETHGLPKEIIKILLMENQ
ncbi:MAG: alanine--tRNA ligase-related protein [bacterium]